MKKSIVCLLVIALFVTIFGAAGAEDSDGKITVWAWDPSFNIAIMKEAAARYEAINPEIKIDIVEMAKADVEQKLNTVLAAKTTEGLPEIVLIEDYNAQKYLQYYPGSFADLTTKFNYNDFAAYKVGVMTLDGKVYGVPFDSGVVGFFYRSDILSEAGFKAEDLKNITWDQFIEIGKTVKEKTGKYMLGFQNTDGGIMRIMMQSAGKWYFDEEGKPALIGNQALVEAFELYKKIVDSGIAKPTNNWNEWVGTINTGESASVTSGVWIVGSIKAAKDQSGLWDVAPVPRLSTVDSKNASNLGGSSWYILDKSADKDAAIDFMQKIYAGDKDFYQTILINNGAVGTYLPAATGEAYSTPDEFFGGRAIYEDLSAWMKEIPPVDYGIYTYEADAAIMAQMEAVCAGTMTIDDAIKAAEAQLENQIQ
ncbi:MAG TPA: extracellular solute-binding protein [Flexilinea sp.]|nr:extracellular solute-binding protein [Flexilinea sp.]